MFLNTTVNQILNKFMNKVDTYFKMNKLKINLIDAVILYVELVNCELYGAVKVTNL